MDTGVAGVEGVSHLIGTDLAQLPVAVLLYDSSGHVLDANQPACELTGMEHDALVGSEATVTGWTLAVPGEGPPIPVEHPAIQAARSGVPQRGVLVRLNRPDGAPRWAQVDAIPRIDAAGEASQVLAVMADVTPLMGEMGFPIGLEPDHSVADVTNQLTDRRMEPELILATVTNRLSRMKPGTWVASLINKDARSLRMVAANDRNPGLARYVEDMNRSGETPTSSMSNTVIETGQPLLVPAVPFEQFLGMLKSDVRSYISRRSIPLTGPVRKVSVMVVPMRARGATVGTLGVYESRSSNPFDERDVAWLQPIADRTAQAVENAQVYADAVRRLERLTALKNIGLAISASPDLRLTLQVILDQVTAGLRVDAADALLIDESKEYLVLAAQTGFQSTSIPDYRLPLDDELPGRILTRPHVETVTEGHAFSELRRRTLFAREGFRTYCAAPLIARGKMTGVLEIFHRTALEPDYEWLSFLEALAGYAAIAIDGARMQDRLQKAEASAARPSAPPGLTALERQILGMVVEGTTNAAIAKALHLSQSTVKFHVRQILQKVGAGNRTELARLATREGWL